MLASVIWKLGRAIGISGIHVSNSRISAVITHRKFRDKKMCRISTDKFRNCETRRSGADSGREKKDPKAENFKKCPFKTSPPFNDLKADYPPQNV
jgi:hypothetical protein